MAIVTRPVRKSADFARLVPDAYRAVIALGNAAVKAGIEPELVELVKLRASHINGCAFCVHMHITEARKLGIDARKLDLLPVWREAGIYTEREIAALAWTEALTLIAGHGVPDAVDQYVRDIFSDQELAGLTAAIGAINVWNRINVSYRVAPAFEEGNGE